MDKVQKPINSDFRIVTNSDLKQELRDSDVLKNREFNEVKGEFVGLAAQGFNLDEFKLRSM
jgi:hypothetical protein